MTRQEKDWENGILRGIERGIQIFLQSGEDTITLSVDVETAKMLAAALREYANSPDKVPDPDTGLMPCGCGGKAEFQIQTARFQHEVSVGCPKCLASSAHALAQRDQPLEGLKMIARENWNRAMGRASE